MVARTESVRWQDDLSDSELAEPVTIVDRLVGAGIPQGRARALIEGGHIHMGDAVVTDPLTR
jgi:hypothetical protein